MLRFVYTLSDPRDGKLRYVGVTDNTVRRLSQHCGPDPLDVSHRANWLRSLLADGCVPVLAIIEEVENGEWIEAERKWIAHFRELEFDLVNSTEGGDGVRGWKPQGKDLERLRTCSIGKKRTPEMRRRYSEAHAGRNPAVNDRRIACVACQQEMTVVNIGRHLATHKV